jgi:RHS repeat-associated protein
VRRTVSHPLGAATLTLHRDARFDVVAVTDATGAVVEKFTYDDYGRADHASTSGLALLFQGQRLDAETGLYYFKNRFYEPSTGRFLSRDSVLDPVNFGNFYTFVGNNPGSRLDPMGLLTERIAFAAGVMFGAGEAFVLGMVGTAVEACHIVEDASRPSPSRCRDGLKTGRRRAASSARSRGARS